jgi:hypothetical protein
MIEKVLKITSLDEDASQQDLAYWLSRPPEDRLVAVQLLNECLIFPSRSTRFSRLWNECL